VVGSDLVPTKIEEILDSSMGSHESLSLDNRLELSHPSLPHPGRLMRLLCPIIGVLICHVHRLRDDLSMCDRIAAQLVCHNLPGLTSMASK